MNVGDSTRVLVSEEHLNILLDDQHLVLLARQPELYRRSVTDRLRAVFSEDRFESRRLKAGPVVHWVRSTLNVEER